MWVTHRSPRIGGRQGERPPNYDGGAKLAAGTGAIEEELALAGVARKLGGALELGAGFVEAAELLQKVAADAGQEVVGLQRGFRAQRIDEFEARGWPEGHSDGDRAVQLDNWRGADTGELPVKFYDARPVGFLGGTRTGVSYDPRRLQGVTLYREAERAFSEGDRVQFTAPNRDQKIANREPGSVEKVDAAGNFRIRLDSGRAVSFNIRENPHLDLGYAVTSHSSQGQTADRVLLHVDTAQAGEKLVNRRLAYVAISRGRYDAQIYTNDKAQLVEGLDRDVSRRSAMEPHRESIAPTKQELPQRELERERERKRTRTQSYSIGR